MSAEAQHRGVGSHQFDPEHAVAYGTRIRSSRPGQTGRDHATDRARGAERRRFESEHLPFPGEDCCQRIEPRAGECRNHKFGRFVFDNAVEVARRERRAGARTAVE